MTGAFAGRNVGETFPVVTAVAKIIDAEGKAYAAIAHEALLDSNPAQVESLLSVHQSLRNVNNGIDDRATSERDINGNPGKQAARFGSTVLPFHFDGTKCFFEVLPISDRELKTLPSITLTDGQVPYEPIIRLHSVRRTQSLSTNDRRRNGISEETTPTATKWKSWLGFPPDHVINKTLLATTQLIPTVEAETREIMRDHLRTRLPQLKVRRVNDRCYVDTFFSSVPSIRGFTCWNLFAFRATGMDVVYLLRRRSQSPTTLSSLITEFGAPTEIVSDNASEFCGKRWKEVLKTYMIRSTFTEPHHPNENLAERRGGALKAATVHLLTVTGAPLQYWCFALEYMSLVRSVLARRSLQWKSPQHECHWGERPDISVFRFIFWQPIWYYNPRQSFPNPKMLKGRFLGVAQNVGDAFCYLILTVPEPDSMETPQVLSRSVIRPRYSMAREEATQNTTQPATAVASTVNGAGNTVTFFRRDETTVLSDPPSIPSTTDTNFLSEEEFDRIEDIVSPIGHPSLFDRPDRQDPQLDPDSIAFDDNIVEVYGPTKSHRASPASDIQQDDPISQDDDCFGVPQNATFVSEEHDNVVVINKNQSTHIVPESADLVADQARIPVHNAPNDSVVNTTTKNSSDDYGSGVPNGGPGRFGSHPITQEDEEDVVEPQLLDDVMHQLSRVAEDSSNDEQFDSIVGHKWDKGNLLLTLRWKTDETSDVPFDEVHHDYPTETADYIIQNRIGTSNGRYSGGRYTRWARQFTRQYPRMVRRLVSMASGVAMSLSDNDADQPDNRIVTSLESASLRVIRRSTVHSAQQKQAARTKTGKRKKPGRISRPVEVKYGVKVPRNVLHAYELDDDEGGSSWADAIKTEVDSLLRLECFEFFEPDYKPSSEYQFTKLTMIFEVKQDGRRKARLVAGGHLLDPRGISSRSTVVKGVSVRLLDLIAHRDGLQVLCGDIGNAFITAECLEKVYTRAGPEFREREGSILVFRKALYGLRSSSRAFRAHFADFLKSMGFVATRYDRDVWMRERETKDGYDYLCTHVDDFKIVARQPDRWKERISAAFLLKSIGPPSYYLGNDYNFSAVENAWVLSCATYVKECIRKIEADLGDGATLYTHRTPLPQDLHPELDDSDLLDEKGIRKYQMLIGMAQWACVIGRLDIGFAVSSLSRFSAAPRQGHLELSYYLFGYLKKNPNRRIVLDSRPLDVDEELRKDSFHPDFLDDYPDAKEDIDMQFPKPYGTELHSTVFFDADHAHDTVTRRSISGLLVFVGSTPVIWSSKRQGCIATSTYCAEFVAMRTAVEEAISIRYMLRCLGIPVTKPTDLFGDNFGVIQSAEIPEGELKKKHIAISYHYVREAIAAKIVNANWCRSDENFADILTKALGSNIFLDIVNEVMA